MRTYLSRPLGGICHTGLETHEPIFILPIMVNKRYVHKIINTRCTILNSRENYQALFVTKEF